jgi:hypothetical protein
MLNMHLLSVNVLVRNVVTQGTEPILIASLDRNSEEVTPYIDLKSDGLRDILRVVLHDIKAISIMEDKPSVTETQQNLEENADVDLDRAKRPFPFPPRARQMCGEHRKQFGR